MNYFDRSNDAMKPFFEYNSEYILYCIDRINKSAGIELLFNRNEKSVTYFDNIINKALNTAFYEMKLNKVYVNVIRDDLFLFHILSAFNFIVESIHREQYYSENTHDIIYMTVLKGEWEKGGIQYKYSYDRYRVSKDS